MFATGDSILYFYDAAGIKLRQEVYKAGTLKMKRDYAGEFYYENDTLRFINHEEGRVTVDIENDILDYQYHLKDHLGNTRLTFSTTPESYTYTATMETELATSEEALFQNVAETRVAMALANSTSQDLVPGANKAARIESTDPIGPLAMLQVNKGDTVKLSAYAYYEGDGSTDGLISESALLAALLSGYSGASGISEVSAQTQAALESGLDFPNNLVPKTNETNDDAPKAYINYMQFDADMNLVTSGFKQITTAAQGMKEYVETAPLTIDQNGYVLVYVSNESDELNWVHFDDFAVTHSKTPIVQVDDYYPFGLTFNSFTRNYSEPQRYKYNGKEEQEDWGVGVLDYGARMYMADIGRFGTQDRFAEKYMDMNPYQYGANNPIFYIDVNGDSLNVSQLRDYDSDASDALSSDLQAKSGLTLTTDADGNVTYAKDEKGKAIVSRDENGKKTGSRAARKALTNLIDSDQMISVAGTGDGDGGAMTITSGNTITFNVDQTNRQIDGTVGVNKSTYGWALTFFHEVGETSYGGNFGADPRGKEGFTTAGVNEKLSNKIRRQLGTDYGQRVTYNSFHYKGKDYFPWSIRSLKRINAGQEPTEYVLQPNSKNNYPE